MRIDSAPPYQSAGILSTWSQLTGATLPGGRGVGAPSALPADGIAGFRLGSQPSDPPSTLSAVSARASSAVSVRAQPARSAVFEPGPVVPNSKNRDVFSRSGLSQLCQPAGQTTSAISVSRKAT